MKQILKLLRPHTIGMIQEIQHGLSAGSTRWYPWATALSTALRHGGILLGLCLPISLISACSSRDTLEAEHRYDQEQAQAEPLRVEDYLPAPNTPGVPKNMQPYFFFNRAADTLEAIQLAMDDIYGGQIRFASVPDFDEAGLRFVPDGTIANVDGYEEYAMSLVLTEDDLLVEDSEFNTDFPEGLLFNMSTDLKCEQFGGSAAQAVALNKTFTPGEYPLWVMIAVNLTADTHLPFTTDLMAGPAYIRSDGTVRIYRTVGLATVFRDVSIQQDGSFSAFQEGEFLPLDTPETVVLTYLKYFWMSGTFDLSQNRPFIRDFKINGVLPTRSLLLLANESESYANQIDMIELDVDLNGNGVNDSATLVVTSQPTVLEEGEWSP